MEDTSGFYNYQDGGLAHAPNFVENSQFSLYRGEHHTHTYPVGGWYWFDSEADARAFFNIPQPVEEELPENTDNFLQLGDENA